MNKRTLLKLTIWVLCVFGLSNIMAINKTWTGSNGTNWSNPNNWSPSGVPNSADNVFIPSSLNNYPILSQDKTVLNLTVNGGSINGNGFELIVNNNASIYSGVLNFNGSLLTIANNNLYVYGGTINIYGEDLYVDNLISLEGGYINSSNSNVVVNNSIDLIIGTLNLNNQNLDVANNLNLRGGEIINAAIVNANSVLVNLTGTCVLNCNLRVDVGVTFSNGILKTTNSNLLIFDYNATVSGASNSSHVNGPVRKEINTNSMNTFIFPTGNGSVYASIEISSYRQRRNQDYFTASYFNVRNSNAGGPKPNSIDHISQAEYWDLNRGASSGNSTTDVQVRLSYNTARSGAISNRNNLRLMHWTGSSWQTIGNNTNGSNTSGTIRSNSRVKSFSPFTLGSISALSPLPITLLSFSATKISNMVSIDWTTNNEMNSSYFVVEKSSDGEIWNSIGKVMAQGNSNTLTNYNTLDKEPLNGLVYYRLKQVDLNGEYAYSKVVSVLYDKDFKLVIYPNPSSEKLFINSGNTENVDIDLQIYNCFGQLVYIHVGNLEQISDGIDINDFPIGVYTLVAKINDIFTTDKFIKN